MTGGLGGRTALWHTGILRSGPRILAFVFAALRLCAAWMPAAALLAACAALPEAPPVPHTAPLAGETYRIVPGDQLSIFVWQDRDLSLTLRVRPDGRISMPLVGELVAAGRTPAELSTELEERLRTFVQEPRVTVIVAESAGLAGQRVRIVGEAVQPRAMIWRPGLTVLDAVIEAGGLTEFADGNRTVLLRREGGEVVRYRVRLADLLHGGDPTANVELAPGDVVVVPESAF